MKRIKIGKIIGIIFFTIVVFGISYITTYYVDNYHRKNLTTDINVTFEDTKEFSLTNTKVLSKDEAMKEWPYIFTIENNGKKKGLYQILINSFAESDINSDNLSYLLYLGDKLVKSGSISSIKDNVLYQDEIMAKNTKKYKMYVYKDKEDEGTVYKYSLKLNAILDTGPGF